MCSTVSSHTRSEQGQNVFAALNSKPNATKRTGSAQLIAVHRVIRRCDRTIDLPVAVELLVDLLVEIRLYGLVLIVQHDGGQLEVALKLLPVAVVGRRVQIVDVQYGRYDRRRALQT